MTPRRSENKMQKPEGEDASKEAERVTGSFTETGKRKQVAKIFMITGVPILALVAVSIYSLIESVQDRMDLVEAKQTVYFTVQVGWLIHLLQGERDTSVLYLTSTAPSDAKALLKELWESTDLELAKLPDWPVNVDKIKRQEFENKKSFKAHLDKHRSALKVNDSLHGEIRFYTNLMRVFMNWLTDSIKKSEHGTLWKTLIAYQKLIACKVETGAERALGELFFTNRGFKSQEDFLWYNKQYNAFTAYFQLAQNYSTLVKPLVTIRTNTTSGQNVVDSVAIFRHLILYQNVSDASMELGNYWFGNITEYLELLLEIQRDLANLITMQIHDYISETDTNVAISCFTMAVALCTFPVLLRAVLKTTQGIKEYSESLATIREKLISEKAETRSLVYQMLPRQVADKIQNEKCINAEYYKRSTVMFSGVASFNKTTKDLPPKDIVDLLEHLYTIFENKINDYNVYKVEKIGDVFMIAAGLTPERRQCHASEACHLALDIMQTCAKTDFPMLTEKLRIRIGIHSGPCTTGVVGKKLPRYCIFGTTVNIASWLERHSLSNRILISAQTESILRKTGNFITHPRCRMTIDIGGTDNIIGTYWLMGCRKRRSLEYREKRSRFTDGDIEEDIQEESTIIESQSEPPKPQWPKTSLQQLSRALAQPRGERVSITDVEKMFLARKDGEPPIVQLQEGFHY